MMEDEDPSVFRFYLVHEFFQDTQRTTKVIIDAGNGKTFKAGEIDKDSFLVHALLTHWYDHAADDMANKVVAGIYRTITRAYVTAGIENINQAAKRDFLDPQAKLPGIDQGRYLVLELASDRGPAPDFQRIPGAEAGWIDSGQMIQHKMDYIITAAKPFKRYTDGGAEEINPDSPYRFARSAGMYNKNEFIPGDISVVFNLFEAARFNNGTVELDYRIYKPQGLAGQKVPLVVWLHGADGRRIDDADKTRWPRGAPPFLQNHGQLLSGSGAAVLANPVTQEKYGPYFVLAPQARGFGHEPAALKAVIDKLLADNPAIDPRRIYFGGTSMGGMGSIDMIMNYPEIVAAAITGPGGLPFRAASADDPATIAKLTNTPIWLVSIYGDNTRMDFSSAKLFDKIKSAGGNVRWTHFPANTNVAAGEGNYTDAGLVPGGFGWAHSAYEPMMSDKITTNYPHNVESVTYTAAMGPPPPWGGPPQEQVMFSPSDISYGRTAPGDTPGDTIFTWLFKQSR